MSRQPHFGRADLHIHTTCSDGLYKPEEIIDLARRSGLGAVAITDHDTLAGVEPARLAAASTTVEVITGVEITTEYQDMEFHILGYFVNPDHQELNSALEWIRRERQERFHRLLEELRKAGVVLSWNESEQKSAPESLGRRYLAELLLREKKVGSIREAFSRYLGDHGRFNVKKARLPIADAFRLVREAGGITSWAHPGPRCNLETLSELARMGMNAVEVDYPSVKTSFGNQLRKWATLLNMEVTAGSDCHGPGKNAPGSCSLAAHEFESLKICRDHLTGLSPKLLSS